MATRLNKLLTTFTRGIGATRFQTTATNVLDPDLATAKSYDEVPQETSLPLIGTTWLFLPFIGKYDPTRRHEASMQQYLKYGKIVREDLTSTLKLLHLFDVQDIEKMWRNEGRYPVRAAFESLQFYRAQRKDTYTNFGLLVEQGSRWHEMRSKVQKHMLRPASVQYYLPVMDTISQELVDRIESTLDSNREIPEFMNDLYKWALESVASVAFDTKLGCLNKGITTESETWNMIKAVNEIFGLMLKLEFSGLKLWRFFPFPSITRFFQCMDVLSNAAQKHMKEAIAKVEKSPLEDRDITFLENLLIKEKMEMNHVTTMITDMVLAGIDTTSHSSAFALYLLAKNQDCQQKLYDEICTVLPDTSSSITVPVLNECRYLKAAIKESMRIFPIVSGSVRTLEQDIVLSGYRVPAGIVLISENLVACRLEENFSDPMKYKPERWLRGMNEEKFNPFVFLPFGFGPRGCIGKRIAEQEMWTLLIRIIQKYRLEYHYEDIGAYTNLVNIPDKPLKLRFIER